MARGSTGATDFNANNIASDVDAGGRRIQGVMEMVPGTNSDPSPITGQSLESGGLGSYGWLSSIRKAITDRLGTLGQKAMAASTPVVVASDQSAVPVSGTVAVTGVATEATLDARTGALTETAPASDTASSGINGRLQRIAQRLSTMIGVLPTALGANGGLKIEGVASGTPIPISGSVTATPSTQTEFTSSPTLSVAGTYASGDYVGPSATPASIASFGSANGKPVRITGVTVLDKAKQSQPLEVWLAIATFTAPTDNAAWSISDADALNVRTVIPVTAWYESALNSVGIAEAFRPIKLGAGTTTIYYGLVTRGAPVYASGDLQIIFAVEQD